MTDSATTELVNRLPIMNQEEYLKDRLQNQIDWYDNTSMKNQNWFKRLQVAAILASATIRRTLPGVDT